MGSETERFVAGGGGAATKKTILLVEDEALISMAESRLLKDEGYDVIQAFHGKGAVEAVRASGKKIDLVLMDIDLGQGMDGTQAAEEILTEHDLPILFLSSHTEKEIVDRTEKITSYGYVVKDSGSVVLLASIKMAFRLHEAHRALRASEDKYAKAFYTSPDAVNINRLADGMFLAINQGFTRIMGYTPEDVMGRSSRPGDLNVWVHDEDRHRLVMGLKEEGFVDGLEAEFQSKDGTIRMGQMFARILDIGGEHCILSITRDITGQKRTEESLQKNEALLRVFFDTAEDNIMVNSVGTDGIPSTFLEVNESTCKSFGYTREEMLKLRPMDITEAATPSEMIEISRKLMTEGRASYEVLGKRKDGTVLTFEVKARRIVGGEQYLIMSVSRDITARKQIETLRERRLSLLSGTVDTAQELTFHDLFDVDEIQEIQDAFAAATGVASIITDPAGVPITAPSGFCHLCQNVIRKTPKGLENCYYSDKMLGKMNPGGPIAQPCLSGGLWDGGTSIQVGEHHVANWLIGQVLDDSIDQEKMLAYAREIGADTQEFKDAMRAVTRMPKEQFLKICNVLYLIAKILSRLAQQNAQQARHIAERERAEEDLRLMVSQKGTLLQELQHRVKNNLSIISSLLSLALPRLKDETARQVFIDAENRIRAMTKIYEQLYRSETLENVSLDTYISDLARGLVANYSLERDRVRLTLNVDQVQIDLKRAVPIGLILNESITNAMKYAFPHGARGHITVELKRNADQVTFSVADDGVGLPEDFKAGTNDTLGMTLTHMLVEQLGGTLAIDGRKGTRLTANFPL
jgi:PAS domain S-box-containing protein